MSRLNPHEVLCNAIISHEPHHIYALRDIFPQMVISPHALSFAAIHHSYACIGAMDECCQHMDVNVQDSRGLSPLMHAAMNNSTECIFSLCHHYPQINSNQQDNNGSSALIIASTRGFSDVISALRTCCPSTNVHIINYFGDSCLTAAATHGHANVITALARNFPNVDEYGQSFNALMRATELGYASCVQALSVFPKLDVNRIDTDAATALMRSALFGHLHCIAALARYFYRTIDPNVKDPRGNSVLMYAIQNPNCIRLLRYFFPNIDVNARNRHGRSVSIYLFTNVPTSYKQFEYLTALHDAFPDIDIHLEDNNGCTAIMWAEYHSNAPCALELRRRYPTLYRPPGTEWFFAANDNDIAVLPTLLAQDPQLDLNTVRDCASFNPLMNAVLLGHKKFIGAFYTVFPRLDPNSFDKHGRTPIELAAIVASNECIEELYRLFPDLVGRGNAIVLAAQYGHSTTITTVCRPKAIPPPYISPYYAERALLTACAFGKSDCIHVLHACFPCLNPNTHDDQGLTPLMYAALWGHADCITAMRYCFANVNANQQTNDGITALMSARTVSTVHALSHCYGKTIDTEIQNHYGHTALINAARKDRPDIIRALHNDFPHIDPDTQSYFTGNSAMHAAVRSRNPQCITALVSSFPMLDPDLQNNDGNTPLHCVFDNESGPCDRVTFRSVLRNLSHANPNIPNFRGFTPFACLISLGWLDYTKQFCQRFGPRINPNVTDGNGCTPLMYAAARSKWDIKFLCDFFTTSNNPQRMFPVDPTLADNWGKTALMYAASHPTHSDELHHQFPSTIDPNVRDRSGRTAIMFATQAARLGPFARSAVQTLHHYWHDIDITVADRDGKTVLMCIVMLSDSPNGLDNSPLEWFLAKLLRSF